MTNMAKITKEDLLKADEQISEAAELTEYAAQAAAQQLADNWEDALRDGLQLEDLLWDVKNTVTILLSWRDKVREIYILKGECYDKNLSYPRNV